MHASGNLGEIICSVCADYASSVTLYYRIEKEQIVLKRVCFHSQVHNADDNFWKPVPDSAAEEGQLRHGPLF